MSSNKCLMCVFFLWILFCIIFLVCMFVGSASTCTTALAACFYTQTWLVLHAFCNVCMLRNGRAKDSPNLKNIGLSGVAGVEQLLSAVVLMQAVLVWMWCIDKTGPVQQPVCFCFVPSVGLWPLPSEDVRPTPGSPHYTGIPLFNDLHFSKVFYWLLNR